MIGCAEFTTTLLRSRSGTGEISGTIGTMVKAEFGVEVDGDRGANVARRCPQGWLE
jgi:hypothetical protein